MTDDTAHAERREVAYSIPHPDSSGLPDRYCHHPEHGGEDFPCPKCECRGRDRA